MSVEVRAAMGRAAVFLAPVNLEIVKAAARRRTGQGCEAPHLLTGKAPAPHSPVIDHVEPHRGNLVLFWDETNLQAMCKAYHDGEKQRLEHAADMGRGGVDP